MYEVVWLSFQPYTYEWYACVRDNAVSKENNNNNHKNNNNSGIHDCEVRLP